MTAVLPATSMSAPRTGAPMRLCLLDGFRLLCNGVEVAVPAGGRQLVAWLGLRGSATRSRAADCLWPEATEARAQGSLRSTLWRLQRSCGPLVHSGRDALVLAPEITVDVPQFTAAAYRILSARDCPDEDLAHRVLSCAELLPGWTQDWVLLERERLSQLRLHALEILVQRLIGQRCYTRALEAAAACVCAEPLRESAHRAVVSVHLAQQNLAEARRHYEFFRVLIDNELGGRPSALFSAMLRSARSASSRHRDQVSGAGLVRSEPEAVHPVDP